MNSIKYLQKKEKSVEIAEYVLPKFDVTIDSPTQFSAKDGKIRAIVRSKYTYGKFVKGEAIVSLTPISQYRYYAETPKDSIIKTITVDGKGSVEFDIVNDLKLDFTQYTKSNSFKLHATVIEDLTGRNQSATKEITIHETRYKVTPNKRKNDFMPGLPITFSVNDIHILNLFGSSL